MKKVVKNLATLKEVKQFAEKSTSEKIALVSKNLSYKGKYKKELIATLVVIFQNLGGNFKSFDTLFAEFKRVMNNENPKREGKNDKTRLRRIITRNIEAILLKQSVQSDLINLTSIVEGIKIKSKTPLAYYENGDVDTKTSDLNEYKFLVNKVATDRDEESKKAELAKAKERIIAKALKFKEAKETK